MLVVAQRFTLTKGGSVMAAKKKVSKKTTKKTASKKK